MSTTPPAADGAVLAAALGNAALGWPVVPLDGKAPRVKDWPSLGDNPPSETTIRRWWSDWPTANLGIVCGGRLRLVVLDADDATAAEAVRVLAAGVLAVPEVRTPRGGAHFYFRAPADVRVLTKTKLGGRALDVRAWGGVVAAPPSVGANGRPYTWGDGSTLGPLPADVPELPTELLGLLHEGGAIRREGVTATGRRYPARPEVLAAPSRIVIPRREGWIVPSGPSCDVLDLLHRDNDGYIAFATGPTGEPGREQWSQPFAIQARELRAMFPAVRAFLDCEAFASVNSFCSTRTRRSWLVNRLRLPIRQAWATQWGTACFADLDVGRPGTMTAWQAVARVLDAVDRGELPCPSIVLRSGAGAWLFWILRNLDPRYPVGGPIRMWPEVRRLWRDVQQAIFERMARMGLCPDDAAKDEARVFRVAGSVHRRSGSRVGYLLPASVEGRPYLYGLADLAAAFGVPADLPRLPEAVSRIVTEAESERGRRGARTRWRRDLQRFESLRLRRGGFRHGHRAMVCWTYAFILLRNRVPLEEVRAAVRQLAAECLSADGKASDPLPVDEAEAQVESARLYRMPMRATTIADRLRVTAEEGADLGWPARAAERNEPEAPADLAAHPTREYVAARGADRQSVILAYVERRGGTPTLRELRDVLAAVGLEACDRTLAKDLVRLGIPNPRSPAVQRARQVPLPMHNDPARLYGGANRGVFSTVERPTATQIGAKGVEPCSAVPSPPEAAREARRPEAPPSPTERAPREAQRPERRAVTTGVPTDAPRVQTAIPGEAEVPVPDLEAEDRERERVERDAQRADLEAQREAEQRAADDLAKRQQEIHTGNHPDHTQDTPEARPEAPESTPRRRPPPMTPDQRREKRAAARVALAVGRLEDEHEQRMAALRVDDQTFAAEVAGALELLEHLDGLTARRQTAAP